MAPGGGVRQREVEEGSVADAEGSEVTHEGREVVGGAGGGGRGKAWGSKEAGWPGGSGRKAFDHRNQPAAQVIR